MERELAHVEKIIDIQPIPGADRVELATVLGWKVMVRKGQFKVGDLAVYIEIDSECPHEEPFTFLEKNHYKIKTQKYFKGTVLSQGLLMSLDDLNIPADSVREGDGLTEKLHIKYSTPEDNYRKKPSADKYKQMARRNPKLFKKPWAQWMMKRPWGKKVMFALFGKKSDKKRGWPEWVEHTDEQRVQGIPWILEKKGPWVVSEKVDGCLDKNVSIVTDAGIMNISEIVNKHKDVNVLTYNESNGRCEYKPILEYHKWERVSDMYDIVVSQQGYRCGNREKHIICTSEHSFFVGDNKYIKAKDLVKTDSIYHRLITIDSYAKEILLGILLGDGSLSSRYGIHSGAVDFSHSIKQRKYFEETVRLLGEGNTSVSKRISGYGSEILCGHYKTNPEFKEIAKKYCIKDGKKYVTKEWANMLTPISLAFWYMDDGSISNADNQNVRPTIHIATNGFSYEECENLVEMLQNKFNIVAEIRTKSTYKGNTLYMNTENADKFTSLIAPYICEGMKYKLPAYLRCISYCLSDYVSTNGNGLIRTDIISIEKLDDYRGQYVYDLTVADNHNYFANGILTHNTSSTYTLKRGRGLFGKDEFYVCSRNVVQETPDQENWYDTNVYWEIEKIYNMRAVLSVLMDILDVDWITIQGEIYGHKIQKRDYGMKDIDFAAFNLITSENGRYGTEEMEEILRDRCGIPCVPIVDSNYMLPDTIDEILEYAGSESSQIDGGMREGVVFRAKDGSDSFKAVSNEYLLKYHG